MVHFVSRIAKIGAQSSNHPCFEDVCYENVLFVLKSGLFLRMKGADYENLQEFCTFADWYEEYSHKDFCDDAGLMVLVECHRI